MGSTRAPTLWVTTPSNGRAAHALAVGSTIVGRGPAAGVQIASPDVSRRHAELCWDGERLLLRDLGSSNGTWVNSRPVSGWVELHRFDVVRFARVDALVDGNLSPAARPEPPVPERRERDAPPPRRVPIFVSHSSEDKHVARMVARYLRHTGWQVWIDEAGIAGGKRWHTELMRALETTWVVLLLVSLHSMRSQWVVREVQAADRLGLRIIPVVVQDAPYPDELRMILAGVQQVHVTGGDPDRLQGQLARLDLALLHAARRGRSARPGRLLRSVGGIIQAIGLVGAVASCALFAYLLQAESSDFSSHLTSQAIAGEEIPRPFYGFAAFATSIVVTGVGAVMHRAGMRRGI